MPSYLIDLFSWVAAFIILGLLFRWLQNRKPKDKDDQG